MGKFKAHPGYTVLDITRPTDVIDRARDVGEALASEVAIRVGANELQRDSIMRLEALVRHGAQSMDLVVRKDGREHYFEADWLKALFKEPANA